MRDVGRLVPILMAEDDAEDRFLTRDAFEACRLLNPLHFVEDGEELLDFLKRRGKYGAPIEVPTPGLILLDLKMPRMSGFEALEVIKKDPELRSIPVVVMTTSSAEEDVIRSYDLGVSGYVTKPVSFDGLVQAVQALGRYWFEIVDLPRNHA